MRNETIAETVEKINATIDKQYTDWHIKHGGFARDMTLRDHYAGLIMQALIARETEFNPDAMIYTGAAYDMADAMIKERNK